MVLCPLVSLAQDRAPGADLHASRPNVLILLFDTLRADRTEPYGGDLVPTPTLRRLASQGATFVNAHATSSYTRTSVASLMTSLYPSDPSLS